MLRALRDAGLADCVGQVQRLLDGCLIDVARQCDLLSPSEALHERHYQIALGQLSGECIFVPMKNILMEAPSDLMLQSLTDSGKSAAVLLGPVATMLGLPLPAAMFPSEQAPLDESCRDAC